MISPWLTKCLLETHVKFYVIYIFHIVSSLENYVACKECICSLSSIFLVNSHNCYWSISIHALYQMWKYYVYNFTFYPSTIILFWKTYPTLIEKILNLCCILSKGNNFKFHQNCMFYLMVILRMISYIYIYIFISFYFLEKPSLQI